MAFIKKYITDTGENRFRVFWRSPDGQQKSKSFDRYTKARDYQTKLEHDLREGSYVEPSKKTVRELLAEWFEIHKHKRGLEYRTIQSYEYNIKHINGVIGGKLVQRLTPGDIELMYKTLSGLSGKYKQGLHSTLNLAFKYAIKTRLLSNNPCAAVDRPKKIKYQASFVHPDDVQKYLDLFSDAWIYPAVVISMFCGLRRGEISGLQWDDVNFKKGVITVRHSVVDIKGQRVLKKPKNNKTRTVNMPQGLVRCLKEYRKKQLEYQLLLGDENYRKSNFVLTEDNGTVPAVSYISRFFNRRIKSSDLPRVRFHDLRHTAASLMILEGTDLKTVSEILGHSSITITADTYAHIIDEAKKKAADNLEKYFL